MQRKKPRQKIEVDIDRFLTENNMDRHILDENERARYEIELEAILDFWKKTSRQKISLEQQFQGYYKNRTVNNASNVDNSWKGFYNDYIDYLKSLNIYIRFNDKLRRANIFDIEKLEVYTIRDAAPSPLDAYIKVKRSNQHQKEKKNLNNQQFQNQQVGLSNSEYMPVQQYNNNSHVNNSYQVYQTSYFQHQFQQQQDMLIQYYKNLASNFYNNQIQFPQNQYPLDQSLHDQTSFPSLKRQLETDSNDSSNPSKIARIEEPHIEPVNNNLVNNNESNNNNNVVNYNLDEIDFGDLGDDPLDNYDSVYDISNTNDISFNAINTLSVPPQFQFISNQNPNTIQEEFIRGNGNSKKI